MGLYAVVIGIAGLLGLILGEYVRMGSGPRLFFLIPLPSNGLGFAVFGMVTVAAGLGLPLALVVYVSQQADAVE
nr:cox cluster protein [Haloplanus sp. XH21]